MITQLLICICVAFPIRIDSDHIPVLSETLSSVLLGFPHGCCCKGCFALEVGTGCFRFGSDFSTTRSYLPNSDFAHILSHSPFASNTSCTLSLSTLIFSLFSPLFLIPSISVLSPSHYHWTT